MNHPVNICSLNRWKSICSKRLLFAEYDVRVPSTNLVGAFLKYGKLEAAEPCVGALDQCNKPTMTQFSKKFIFEDIEWTDDFLDPGMASTVEKMEEIAETVN